MESLSYRAAASSRTSHRTEIKKEQREKVKVASMTNHRKRPHDPSKRSIARWENEGGATKMVAASALTIPQHCRGRQQIAGAEDQMKGRPRCGHSSLAAGPRG